MKRRQGFNIQFEAKQALVDHRNATLNLIVAQIPELTTFGELAELVEWSYEWVRVRLMVHPERLYKIGKRYKVPRGVAEEFVRSVFV